MITNGNIAAKLSAWPVEKNANNIKNIGRTHKTNHIFQLSGDSLKDDKLDELIQH